MPRIGILILVFMVVVGFLEEKKSDFGEALYKNPGSLSDGLWNAEKVRSSKPRVFQQKLQGFSGWASHQIWSKTSETRLLSGTQLALWWGDLRGLPFWLIEKYRSSGLLAVLAISGQHVSAFVLCLSGLGALLLRFFNRPRGFYLAFWRSLKLPLTASVLFSLAGHEASVLRTLLCVFCFWVFSTLPILYNKALVCAFLLLTAILVCPPLASSKGFILSGSGVVGILLSQKMFQEGNPMIRVFLSSLWTWLWLSPILLFYFGQWTGGYLAIQWIMGWIWETLYLPLFFLIGLVLIALPLDVALFFAETLEKILTLWGHWEALNANASQQWVYRPRVWEIGLFWCWLVASGSFVQNARLIDFMRRARRQ